MRHGLNQGPGRVQPCLFKLVLPGQQVACNSGLCSVNFGLLQGLVGHYSGTLGFPSSIG